MEEEKRLQHTHGIITQAKIMLDDGLILYPHQQERIEDIFIELNSNLPCPPYGIKQWPANAISWFYDSSYEFLALMYELKFILEEYDAIVTVLKYDDVGTVLYRDLYQVIAKSSKL